MAGPKPGQWAVCLEEDGIVFTGAYETKEAAFKDCPLTNWLGQYRLVEHPEQGIDAEEVLFLLRMHSPPYVWEPPNVTPEQERELTEEVQRVVRDWIERHGLLHTFMYVERMGECMYPPTTPNTLPCTNAKRRNVHER